MRPRRVRLGYRDVEVGQERHHGASMRPRRVRLGYLPANMANPSTTASFNEAEARPPRIRSASFAAGKPETGALQ